MYRRAIALLIAVAVAVAVRSGIAEAGADFAPLESTQQRVSSSRIDVLLPIAAASAGKGFVPDLSARIDGTRQAIVVESGTLTLSEIMATGGRDRLTRTGNVFLLAAPLIVWHGASVSISPGEQLVLDGAKSAFVINAGRLRIVGAHLRGAGTDTFRPFVLTVAGGSLDIRRSLLEDMGYGDRAETSGLSVIGHGATIMAGDVEIRSSMFNRLHGLTVTRVNGGTIAGNTFHESKGSAIRLVASSRTSVGGNVVAGTASHGLSVSGGYSLTVVGNDIKNTLGHGIYLDGGTVLVSLRANRINGALKSGIAVDHSACVEIEKNSVTESRFSGILVDDSFATSVTGNMLRQNRQGLTARSLRGVTPLKVGDNAFYWNRSGLGSDGSGDLLLVSNDFRQQWPRLLEGRIVDQTGHLLGQSQTDPHRNIVLAGDKVPTPLDRAGFSALSLSACYQKEGE